VNGRRRLENGEYADYSAILRQDSLWQPGTIKLADDSTWTYQEPDAKVTVRRERLRIRVIPFTRHHDIVQTLDNSKHLYFSRSTYPESIEDETEYAVSMSARGVQTNEGEIYDGFVAFHLLDAESGIAADFFASNNSIAIAYSRPKVTDTKIRASKERKYLAVFKEVDVKTSSGELHDYRIIYNPEQDRISWSLDGEMVSEEKNVPSRVKSFRLGLGVMTAKTITNGKSISNHGQGIIGQWSPVRITQAKT